MKTYKWQEIVEQEALQQEIIARLQDGQTLVYPTETAYGLGADPRSAIGVERVYQVKKRAREMKLPLIAAHRQQVEQFFHIDDAESTYIAEHWPGPYVVLLQPIFEQINSWAVQYERFAIRVSGSEVARQLAAWLGVPIVSTSANLSGEGAQYDSQVIRDMFVNADVQPDMMIDVGIIPPNKPSQIVRFENGQIEILRA